MKTIYELIRYDIKVEFEIDTEEEDDDAFIGIDTEEEDDVIIPPSYPSFKVSDSQLGFYTSLEKVEAAMRRDIEEWNEENEPIYCYRVNEYLPDCYDNRYGNFLYGCRSYLPNGDLMDTNPTPEGPCSDDGYPKFSGRTPERIRFRKNDFVEVLESGYVMLGIVYNAPPTTDMVRDMHWDGLDHGDDSYLVVYIEKEDYEELIREDFHPDDEYWQQLLHVHCHPLCVNVFPPRFPIPEKLREILLKMN